MGEIYSDERIDICTDMDRTHNNANVSDMEVRETIIKLLKGNLKE